MMMSRVMLIHVNVTYVKASFVHLLLGHFVILNTAKMSAVICQRSHIAKRYADERQVGTTAD